VVALFIVSTSNYHHFYLFYLAGQPGPPNLFGLKILKYFSAIRFILIRSTPLSFLVPPQLF